MRVSPVQCERVGMSVTSLIDFVQLHDKVNRDVSALNFRSTPCFCPFCGSSNYPVFGQTFYYMLIYINNAGRTLILGLPRKQNGYPIGYITLQSLISRPKRRLSHL